MSVIPGSELHDHMLEFIRPEMMHQHLQKVEHMFVITWYFAGAVAREQDGDGRVSLRVRVVIDEVPDGTFLEVRR